MSQQTLEPPTGSRSFPDQHPARRWASLHPGDCVEVWSHGKFRYLAHVDDRTDDGTLLWVIETGMASRHLFIQGDPVTVHSIQKP